MHAINLMKEMDVVGFYCDTITFTTLMDAYCKMGEMVKAHELLRDIHYKNSLF
jgi:pentatricopeptide repeat protein